MEELNNNVIGEFFEKLGILEENDRDEFFKKIDEKHKVNLTQDLDLAVALRKDKGNGKIYLSIKKSRFASKNANRLFIFMKSVFGCIWYRSFHITVLIINFSKFFLTVLSKGCSLKRFLL